MEKFKELEQLTKIDDTHILMSGVTGYLPDLKKFHRILDKEKLNNSAPDIIKGQFNIAKNMAIYSYYFYALATETQLKIFTVIEFALKLKADSTKRLTLRPLIKLAIKNNWITDKGFRRIEEPNNENILCLSLGKTLPELRNGLAHGTNDLDNECLHHIFVCADLINQLYPASPHKNVANNK